MPENTLKDCRDIFYWILRETEDVQAYPVQLADAFINKAQLSFCSGRMKNPLSGERVQKWRLPFINWSVFYESLQSFSVEQTANKWDLKLFFTQSVLDSLPDEGSVYVKWYSAKYSAKNGDWSIQLVEKLPLQIKWGAKCYIERALPSDFLSPIWMVYDDKVPVVAMQYDDIFESQNANKPWMYALNSNHYWYNHTEVTSMTYTIKDWAVIIMWWTTSDEYNHFRYVKKPARMVDPEDKVTIDQDEYSHLILWYFAVGEMLYNRGEESRGAELISFAMSTAQELYDLYNNSTMERQSGRQYRAWKDSRRLNV